MKYFEGQMFKDPWQNALYVLFNDNGIQEIKKDLAIVNRHSFLSNIASKSRRFESVNGE